MVKKSLYLPLFLLGLLGLLQVYLSYIFQFIPWPEMLTYPWLISQQYHLYKDIILPYTPGLIYLLYVFFMATNFSVASLHFISVFLLIVTDIVLFAVALQIQGIKKALYSVLFFGGVIFFFEGNTLWFDNALVPILLLLIFVTLRISNRKKELRSIVIGALLFGTLIIIKQTALVFILPSAVAINNRKNLLIFICWALLPIGILSVWYWIQGIFPEYFYWSWFHPLFVHYRLPGFKLFPTSLQLISTLIFFSPAIFIKKNILHLWLLVCLIFAVPRFAYFHLIPALSVLALMIPQLFLLSKKIPYKIFIFCYFSFISISLIRYSKHAIYQKPRFFDNQTEIVRTAIEQSINIKSTVYFYNVPSQYFVTSTVLPVKPWADNFPWYLEVAWLQQQIVTQLDTVENVVYSPPLPGNSYDLGSYQPSIIDHYIKTNYRMSKRLSDNMVLLERVQ